MYLCTYLPVVRQRSRFPATSAAARHGDDPMSRLMKPGLGRPNPRQIAFQPCFKLSATAKSTLPTRCSPAGQLLPSSNHPIPLAHGTTPPCFPGDPRSRSISAASFQPGVVSPPSLSDYFALLAAKNIDKHFGTMATDTRSVTPWLLSANFLMQVVSLSKAFLARPLKTTLAAPSTFVCRLSTPSPAPPHQASAIPPLTTPRLHIATSSYQGSCSSMVVDDSAKELRLLLCHDGVGCAKQASPKSHSVGYFNPGEWDPDELGIVLG